MVKFLGTRFIWGQRSNVRIGEITNSSEYRMDEQNQNLPIFGIKLWFSKLKKKFRKISQIFIIDEFKKK